MANLKTAWANLQDGLGNRFSWSHVKSIYYNWATKKLLSTKLDEMDALINSKVEKAMMSNQYINDVNKIPTSALVYALSQRAGVSESLQVGSNLTNAINQLNSDLGKIKFHVTYVELPAGQDWYYPDIWIPTYVQWLPVAATVQDCPDDTLMAITQAKFVESGQLFVKFNKSFNHKVAIAIQAIFKSP